MSDRFYLMQSFLDKSKFFKLVCGAGNEDAEEVKKLTILYTLSGAKGLDVSANVNVVKSCVEGIEIAFNIAKKLSIPLKLKPWITVSVGMPGDHHVRKANIDNEICTKCCLCIKTCPTNTISENFIVNQNKCIGCGHCGVVCPVKNAVTYKHNSKIIKELLRECLEAGAENLELHAAIANDTSIMEEWSLINDMNKENYNSMCLDRLHLSDFALETRIKKAKEIAGDKLIIQADGYPMSGGENDYNSTLQAVAIADVINKRFNVKFDIKNKTLKYLEKPEIYLLLSGGTNALTTTLAKQNNVLYHGSSIGSYARKLVKDIISNKDFYSNIDLINQGYLIAKELVKSNVGEINE